MVQISPLTAPSSDYPGGDGSLVKIGSGSMILTNGGHTYSGATTISDGTLRLLDGGALPDSSAVTVNTGGTLDLNNLNDAVGSLAGEGNVILGSATLTSGGNNGSTTYSGVMRGSGGLTKTGTGTLTLSGSNAYAGRHHNQRAVCCGRARRTPSACEQRTVFMIGRCVGPEWF